MKYRPSRAKTTMRGHLWWLGKVQPVKPCQGEMLRVPCDSHRSVGELLTTFSQLTLALLYSIITIYVCTIAL